MRTLAYRVLTLSRVFSNSSKRRYASNEDKKTAAEQFLQQAPGWRQLFSEIKTIFFIFYQDGPELRRIMMQS